jgi:N-acetylmuramate 1-kinase
MKPEAAQFARNVLGVGSSTPIQETPLGERGSDRAFFRITWPPHESAIVIDYDPKRQENCYHAQIATFLEGIGVPVPHVIGHDPSIHVAVTEDLGETDLWSIRNGKPSLREELYRQTIALMGRLHSFPEKGFPSEQVPLMAPFDAQLYKWERDYFRDHFVERVCHVRLDTPFADALETELSGLAGRLLIEPRCLVHRDLQSQNVMIYRGEPVLIDFQGMRFGNPFYDLGSFLCDPYVGFADQERMSYLSAYYALCDWGYNWEAFKNLFWEASVQRLMQALGAYGFLGLSKGLSAFLGHIPAGLSNLEMAADHAPDLPHLCELLRACRKAWTERAANTQGTTL